MPVGDSPKREHEYKEMKAKLKEEHRYPGREEEVAARIVNKQRAEHGETKSRVTESKSIGKYSMPFGKSDRRTSGRSSDGTNLFDHQTRPVTSA